jgi:outer membrane protein assembly factor BamB
MAATMALQRRRLLALLAAGSAGLAGCRATEDGGSDPTTTPTVTSTSSPRGTPGGASAVGCPPYERSSPDRVVCSADPPEDALVFEPDRSTVDLPRGTVACRLENTSDESFSTNFYSTTLHKHQNGTWHFLGPYVVPQPLHTLPPGGTHVRRFHVDNTDLERVDFPEPETPTGTASDDAWVTARHGLGPGTYALGIDSAGEGSETVYSAAVTLRGPDPGLVAPETVTGTERDGDHVTVDVEPRHEDAERHDLTVLRVEDPSGEARPLVDEHLYHPRFAGLRAALASIGDAASVTVRDDDSAVSRNLASGMGARLVRHRGTTYRLRLGGPPESGSRSYDLSGGWREFAADRANTGVAATTGPGPGEPTRAWRFESPGRLYDSPTVAGDLVLQPSTDGNLYALTAAECEEAWRFAVRGQCRTTPAVVDGTVYVAGRDGGLYALDATSGEPQWRFDGSPEGYSISHPTVADGTVYIGDDAGTLFAVDAASGEERWSYATGDDIATSPAVADGTVYVGWRTHDGPDGTDGEGGIDAVSTDGTREWRVRPGNVDGSPTVVDGTVYAGSEAGLLALEAGSGETRWTLDRDPMSGSPAVADGTVYVGTHEGNLHALDAASGEEQWYVHTDKWCDYAPAVAGDLVYHTSWDAHVYAVDRATGEERWRVPFEVPLSAPVVADGTVYAASNRSLVALRED